MDSSQDTITKIREFNRFYTAFLGFLNRNYLDSGYSITEMRILFELKENKQISANRLIEMLRLDKGYISRLIRNFEQKGMLLRAPAPDDRRTLEIRLTPKGLDETEHLIQITNREIGRLIGPLTPDACHDLCRAMEKITAILSDSTHFREEKQ